MTGRVTVYFRCGVSVSPLKPTVTTTNDNKVISLFPDRAAAQAEVPVAVAA